jgi:Tfp pilus assembly protein PilO
VTTRDRIVIAIVVSLVAVVGGWLLVIQPKRSQASKLGKQVSAAQTQLQTERELVAQGEAARQRFATSYTKLARLGEAVPSDDNVPSLIYQLQGAAATAGVDFRALVLQPGAASPAPSVSAPSAGTAGAAASSANSAASTANKASAASSGSTTPTTTTSSSTPSTASPSTSSASATPGSVQAATALAGALPPGATVGPAGFPAEQFAFTFQGSFFHLAKFFKRLESFVVANNRAVAVSGRLMTLNALSLGPSPQGFPAMTAAVSATTYLVPAAQGVFNGATPAGPSSTATQAASASSSPATPPTATIAP